MDVGARPVAPLPSIAQLDPGGYKREEAEIQAAQTMVNINPHAVSAPHSGPPPSYAYATSTPTGSVPTSATTLKTSESYNSSQTDYDVHPNSAPPKQSLPSIHEALSRREEEASRPSERPRSPRLDYYRRHSSPSPSRFGRSHLQEHSQDPYTQPKPQYAPSWPTPPSPRSYGPVAPARRPPTPPSAHETWATPISRAPQSYQPPTSLAPAQSPSSTPHPQYGPPQQSPSFTTQSYVYSSHQNAPPPATYGPPAPSRTSYQPPSAPTYASRQESIWSDNGRNEFKYSNPDPRELNPSRKHPLDNYDLDSMLNEVHECSYNLMQFSEIFRNRSHQAQRSGPISGTVPSTGDVHEAMKFNSKIREALDHVMQKVHADEAERAAERAAREALEKRQARTEQIEEPKKPLQQQEAGEGGFANADTKKRRGRAAPPGRCHACNRAETPEWRRGPDGARTLCNACGLHYAKHTRKLGAQKAGLGGSNLRPKSAGGQN